LSAPVIFSGPTITPADVLGLCPGATAAGPAACGDVLKAVRACPAAIVVIDGVFDQRPSVWHKEILWALSRGIPVYGGASMGALRAAELAHFGMVGVGLVFEWFAAGRLEDDDEVALIHDPSERGYAPRSEAMVNIRSTLEAAVVAGVLTNSARDALIRTAKAQFYPDRSYTSLLAAGSPSGLDHQVRRALSDWLQAGHRIDQKRQDALALIDRLNADLRAEGRSESGEPHRAFLFENTDGWQSLLWEIEEQSSRARSADGSGIYRQHEKEEENALFDRAWAAALERAFCLWVGQGTQVQAEVVQRATREFCHRRGLFTSEQTRSWVAARGIGMEDLDNLIHEEVVVERFRERVSDAARAQLPSVLRLIDTCE
jgi:hypothetical protein